MSGRTSPLPGHTLLTRLVVTEVLASLPLPCPQGHRDRRTDGLTDAQRRPRGPTRLHLLGRRRKAQLHFEGQQSGRGALSLQAPSTPGSHTPTGRGSIHSHAGAPPGRLPQRKARQGMGVHAPFELKEGHKLWIMFVSLCVLQVLLP